MKNRMIALMVVTVCACGKGKGASDDCAAAASHLTQSTTDSVKDMPESVRSKVAAAIPKITNAIAKSCRDDRWSADVLTCIKDMKSTADGKACESKLTPEQGAHVRKAVDEAQASVVAEVNEPSTVEKTDAIKEMTSLRDEMCACKDKGCGEAVMKKWADAEKKSEGARHDEATKKAWQQLDDEMMDCLKTKR